MVQELILTLYLLAYSSTILRILSWGSEYIFNFLETLYEFLWFATMTLLNMYPSYIFKGFQIISYLSIYEVPETREKMLKSTANYSHEENVQVRHRVLKTLI